MSPQRSTNASFTAGTYYPAQPDPISLFFDVTMIGSTPLTSGPSLRLPRPPIQAQQYVTLRAEAILEYEQTITELRRQLLHYKKLVSELLGRVDEHDGYYAEHPVIPESAASVRIVNSILQAHTPEDATFRDFDEGEL